MCCNKESAKELKQARAPLSRQASSLGKRGAWAAHLTFVLILIAHWTGWHSCSLGAALAASHASSRSRSHSYPSMTFPPFGLSLTGSGCPCCSGTEPIANVPAKPSPQKLELAFSASSLTIWIGTRRTHTKGCRRSKRTLSMLDSMTIETAASRSYQACHLKIFMDYLTIAVQRTP